MKTQTTFRPYSPVAVVTCYPPGYGPVLPEDHLVYFIRDVERTTGSFCHLWSYDGTQGGIRHMILGLMTTLLIYAYCVGCKFAQD